MSSLSELKLSKQQFFIQNKEELNKASKEIKTLLNNNKKTITKFSNYKKRLLVKYNIEMESKIETILLTEKESIQLLNKNITNITTTKKYLQQKLPKTPTSPLPPRIDKKELEIKRYLTGYNNFNKYRIPSPDSINDIESFFKNKYHNNNISMNEIINKLNFID